MKKIQAIGLLTLLGLASTADLTAGDRPAQFTSGSRSAADSRTLINPAPDARGMFAYQAGLRRASLGELPSAGADFPKSAHAGAGPRSTWLARRLVTAGSQPAFDLVSALRKTVRYRVEMRVPGWRECTGYAPHMPFGPFDAGYAMMGFVSYGCPAPSGIADSLAAAFIDLDDEARALVRASMTRREWRQLLGAAQTAEYARRYRNAVVSVVPADHPDGLEVRFDVR